MRYYKTAIIFSIMLLHMELQRCHGGKINVTKLDHGTREEVLLSAKDAAPFEYISRNSVFRGALPYLHYLCSAMLRPATNRQTPSASASGSRTLHSDLTTRELSANANSHNSSVRVAYIRDWVRKEMFGKISYSRMIIIQSVLNGMCNKIYTLPEGQYLLHTHKINYDPNSTFNNQTNVLRGDKDDSFSDLETELKDMKTNASTHFRGSEILEKDQEKNETEQNVNRSHPLVMEESGKLKQLNRAITNIASEDNSKSETAPLKDVQRSLGKSVDVLHTFRKSGSEGKLESTSRDEKSSNNSSNPYSENTSNMEDKLNGRMRQNIPNRFNHRNFTEPPKNTERASVIESQLKVEGDSNKNSKGKDKDTDDDEQEDDEDEMLRNLELKLKALKPSEDSS